MKFKAIVVINASDEKVDKWIQKSQRRKTRKRVIKWDREMADLQLRELPERVHEWIEPYVAEATSVCLRNRQMCA